MTKSQLEMLIRAHQAEIYRYVRYLGATLEEAEDLVQETFLNAFESKRPPDLDEIRLRAAWLRGICRNLFFAHCRKMQKHRDMISELRLEEDEQFWVSRFLRTGDGFDFHDALRACLAAVPEKSRQVLDWFYADGLSRDQTAEAAGMSQDGVKSLLRRVRAKLEKCITSRLQEGGAS